MKIAFAGPFAVPLADQFNVVAGDDADIIEELAGIDVLIATAPIA